MTIKHVLTQSLIGLFTDVHKADVWSIQEVVQFLEVTYLDPNDSEELITKIKENDVCGSKFLACNQDEWMSMGFTKIQAEDIIYLIHKHISQKVSSE